MSELYINVNNIESIKVSDEKKCKYLTLHKKQEPVYKTFLGIKYLTSKGRDEYVSTYLNPFANSIDMSTIKDSYIKDGVCMDYPYIDIKMVSGDVHRIVRDDFKDILYIRDDVNILINSHIQSSVYRVIKYIK